MENLIHETSNEEYLLHQELTDELDALGNDVKCSVVQLQKNGYKLLQPSLIKPKILRIFVDEVFRSELFIQLFTKLGNANVMSVLANRAYVYDVCH